MKIIEVSTDVYAAIWKNHSIGEENEDEILRRILKVRKAATDKETTMVRKTKWIEDIVEGFNRIGGSGHYAEIYRSVLAVRKENGHPIPPSFEAVIRREIEYNSSDSDAFKEKADLFCAPKGLRAGFWSLR